MPECGAHVDHVIVFFGGCNGLRHCSPTPADSHGTRRGDRWFVEKAYVKVNGVWRHVHPAVDQHGQIIDVLVSPRRAAAAAGRRFFRHALTT